MVDRMLLNERKGLSDVATLQPSVGGGSRVTVRRHMPVDGHPSAELRAAYKVGNISPGAALAISVHAERCTVCRVDLQCLVGSGRSGRVQAAPDIVTKGVLAEAECRALDDLRASPWRWLGPGVRAAELHGASGLGEAANLLKPAPGSAFPAKALRSLGQVVVLKGSLHDGDAAHPPGDFLDAETPPLRRLVAERPDGCLCLVITDGSWPGRGMMNFVGWLRPGAACCVAALAGGAASEFGETVWLQDRHAAEAHVEQALRTQLTQGAVYVHNR